VCVRVVGGWGMDKVETRQFDLIVSIHTPLRFVGSLKYL